MSEQEAACTPIGRASLSLAAKSRLPSRGSMKILRTRYVQRVGTSGWSGLCKGGEEVVGAVRWCLGLLITTTTTTVGE